MCIYTYFLYASLGRSRKFKKLIIEHGNAIQALNKNMFCTCCQKKFSLVRNTLNPLKVDKSGHKALKG